MGNSFFDVLSVLAVGFSCVAIYVAIRAVKANLHQAKQLQTLYQVLATLQLHLYEGGEDEEWEEFIQDESPQLPTSHRVIDLVTRKGMTYNSETEEWEHD